MLFLSRCIHVDEGEYVGSTPAFGVVDTDDGVEQIVSMVELVDAVCNCGLKIEGFELSEYGHSESIAPYQDVGSMTAAQTKLLVMNHVLVTTYRGMITGINFNGADVEKPVEIRLSSIGHSCADYLLVNGKNHDSHKLTLIIDDKLKFTKHSFAAVSRFSGRIGVDGYGIVFDLRGLRDDDAAEVIYRNVFDSGSRTNSIMDSRERRKRMNSKLIPSGYYA